MQSPRIRLGCPLNIVGREEPLGPRQPRCPLDPPVGGGDQRLAAHVHEVSNQ